jgi:hypothetical protein
MDLRGRCLLKEADLTREKFVYPAATGNPSVTLMHCLPARMHAIKTVMSAAISPLPS